MAELVRVARPWLLPPLRRSIRTPTIVPPYLRPGYSRGKSWKVQPVYGKMKAFQDNQHMSRMHFLLPYTIVPPPIWRFPLSPSKFAQMVYTLAKNRTVALMSTVGFYILSVTQPDGRYGLPQFRTRKRSAVPAAKALHAQMSEAVAAGDKDTLRRVCTKELFGTLGGAVDQRPPGQRAVWELVRYTNKLRYPRLADFRVMYQPGPDNTTKQMQLVKQAVVSISSVQRIARYEDAKKKQKGAVGAKIPGSEREQHLVEHIVLQAEIDDKTWEAGPWQVWGTLPEMSFEKIREDEKLFRELI